MKVRCVSNSGSFLPKECLDPRWGYSSETEFPLTTGRVYVVYAMTTQLAHLWYYVLDDNQLPYPVWQPSPLFDVVDGSLPGDWLINHHRSDNAGFYPLISYPAWANDGFYYERLVDGEPEAVQLFSQAVRTYEGL